MRNSEELRLIIQYGVLVQRYAHLRHFILPVIRASGRRVISPVLRSVYIDNHLFMEVQNV